MPFLYFKWCPFAIFEVFVQRWIDDAFWHFLWCPSYMFMFIAYKYVIGWCLLHQFLDLFKPPCMKRLCFLFFKLLIELHICLIIFTCRKVEWFLQVKCCMMNLGFKQGMLFLHQQRESHGLWNGSVSFSRVGAVAVAVAGGFQPGHNSLSFSGTKIWCGVLPRIDPWYSFFTFSFPLK